MKKGFRKISTLVLTIGLILSLLGITYAFFEYTLTTNSIIYDTGEIWFKLLSESNTLSLDGVLPETREEALYVNGNKDNIREDNIIEFTLQSKNTGAKNIWYELNIVEGAEVPSKTRLDKKYIRFDLFDVTNDNYILKDVSFNEFPDGKIYVDAVTTEHDINDTSSYFEITYRVRAWIDYDLIVSDTDPQADYCVSDSCTTGKPIFSNYYGSVQINVKSDQIEKSNPFAYIRNQTENKESYFANQSRMYSPSNGMGRTFGGLDYDFNPQLNGSSNVTKEGRLSEWTMLYPSDIYLYDENGVPSFNTNGFYKYAETIENINVVKLSEEEINEMLVDPTVLYLKDITDDRVSNSSKVYMYIKANGNTIDSKPAYDLTIASSAIIMFPENSSNMFSYFEFEPDREAAYQKYLIACQQFDTKYSNYTQTEKDNIQAILTNNHNPKKQGYTNAIDLVKSYLYDYYMVGYDYLFGLNGYFSYVYPTTEESYILGYSKCLYDPLLSYYRDIMGTNKYDFDYLAVDQEYNNGIGQTFTSQAESILRIINSNDLVGKKVTQGFKFRNIKNIEIDNVCTSQVTDMSGMFMYNDKLESVDLSNFNTRNVQRLDAMFLETKIPNLNLSSFNTNNVKSLFITFAGAEIDNLTGLDNWNLSNLRIFRGIFTDFITTGTLDLSGWKLDTGLLQITDKGGTQYIYDLDTVFDIDFLSSANYSYDIQQSPFYHAKINTLNLSNWIIRKNEGDKTQSNLYLFTQTGVKTLILNNSLFKDFHFYFNYSYRITSIIARNAIFEDVDYSDFYNYQGTFDFTNIKIRGTARYFYTYLNNKVALDSIDFSEATSLYYFARGCTDTQIDLSKYKFDYNIITSTNSMFYGCSKLTSINFGNFNTSNVTNMGAMFDGCSKLTSLDVSSFNTSKVTTMINMFNGCSKLTSLNLSNFNTSNVNDMYSMFYSCSSLTSLNLSNFNTSNVIDMTNMFFNCSSLTSLDLSSFNTSNVETMDYMFYKCSSLTSLNLSNFNTSNVTTMYSMFDTCSSLTSLNLSSFNTSNVTTMYSMFYNCSSLTNLNLSNFNANKVTRMNFMFYGCSSLPTLNLSGWTTSSLTRMDAMFQDCVSLTSLNLSSFNTSNVTDMSSTFRNCPELVTLTLGSNFTGQNLKTMNSMFMGDYKITSIDFSHLGQTKVTDMWCAFQSCTALRTLNLSNFKTLACNIQWAFTYCWELTAVDLTGVNVSATTNFSELFKGCNHLTSLNLSTWNTSNGTNMAQMFYECYRLSNLNLSGWNTKKVTNMDSMFYKNQCLTTLNISSFDTYSVTNFSSMFGWSGGDTSQYGSSSRGITKIIVSSYNSTNQTGWTIINGGSTTDGMFTYTSNLVGGAGTTNTWEGRDHTYARIDGGTSAPGLLSSS